MRLKNLLFLQIRPLIVKLKVLLQHIHIVVFNELKGLFVEKQNIILFKKIYSNYMSGNKSREVFILSFFKKKKI